MILFFRYILVCPQSGKILKLRPSCTHLSTTRVFKEDGHLKQGQCSSKDNPVSTSSLKLTVCRCNIELGKKRAETGAVLLRKDWQRAFWGKVSEEGGGKCFIIMPSFRYSDFNFVLPCSCLQA